MLSTILMTIGGGFTAFWTVTFSGIFFLPYIWSDTSIQKQWRNIRKRMSMGALGLKNNPARKKKNHSIIDMNKYKDKNDYIKSLGRSAKTSIKNCEKKFKKNSIAYVIKDQHVWKFTLNHMKIIYEHQARNTTNIIKLIFKTLIRSMAVNMTIGCLIEYYVVNPNNNQHELIAFQQPIIKGNVYRAMWFYQKSKYSKSSIWFHALKYAVNHVVNDETLRYIDLGPSYNKQVQNLKTKFGFEHSNEWREICSYSGDFRSLLSA
eukprot:203828_1